MTLENKVIVILSPQKWKGLSISKHHYAIELAKKGNEVYFVQKGDGISGKVQIEKTEYNRLNLVIFNDFISDKIRFHFRSLYDIILRTQVNSILRKISRPIDIVWSFDLILFKNLNWFKAKLKIFHPVDLSDSKVQLEAAKTADILFSVAPNILDKFNEVEIPKKIINHGLSAIFLKKPMNQFKQNEKLRFAYIGNLTMHGIDFKSINEIVSLNQSIDFDFYGSTIAKSNQGMKNQENLRRLQLMNNVSFKGMVSPAKLSDQLMKYDGFILCYNSTVELNGGANSHKILEYLSFGKVIVSSKLSMYKKYKDLIPMSTKDDNSDYVELFNGVVKEITKYNSELLVKARRELAEENSYLKQIERIENYIRELENISL